MRLEEFSEEQLKEELDRREAARRERVAIPFGERDWTKMGECVVNGVYQMIETGREINDFERHVFELAIEAVYGSDCWGWYNDLTNR